MTVSEDAALILSRLAGYETYFVGGCVRDALRGVPIHDVDFCTAAHPEAVLSRFSDCTVLRTGIRHGTVTVLLSGKPYEITTFRADGAYTDGRHPDQVTFGSSIVEDLARRDFTVNAMAYRPDVGLVDPFGGREDLNRGILRAVGDPARRFSEDALRILRGVRFVAQCGFSVEARSAQAMRANADRLAQVSAERIYAELKGILLGEHAAAALRDFSEVLFSVLPCLAPLAGFDQKNPHHCFDVWEHTLHALEVSERDLFVRLALLFHDAGKPACASFEQGVGHFYGHAARSAEIAENALSALRADRSAIETTVLLVSRHSDPVVLSKRALGRLLRAIGEENFRRLVAVKRADIRSLAPSAQAGREEALDAWLALFTELQTEEACFSRRQLKLDGNDLLALGFRGREIGSVLEAALDAVLDGTLPNDHEKLCEFARRKRGSGDPNR